MRFIRTGGLAALLSLAAGAAHADITIAVAGPLSGALSSLGQQMQSGAQMAVTGLNASGGVLGQPVTLVVEDDACDVTEATAAANRIVGAGAVFVAGHLCSTAAIAASAVYADAKIVDIAPGAPDPRFTDERPGSGIFRLFGRDDAQAPATAAFIAAHHGGQTIAVFDDDTRYGSDLADAVRLSLQAIGIEPALVDTFNRADPQTDALLDRLVSRSIQVVYVAAYPPELATLAEAIRGRGLPVTLIAGDAAGDPAFVEAAGDAAVGTEFMFQLDPRLLPSAVDAVDAFRAAGDEPDGITLYTFAAIQVWVAAVEAAGTTDFDAVTSAIAAGDFETVLGTATFAPNGDVNLPGWVAYRWGDDGYAPVE